MTTSREVSQYEGTLGEAIAAGEIPVPPLMEYNEFIKWRREVGRRPTLKTDGVTTTSRQAATL